MTTEKEHFYCQQYFVPVAGYHENELYIIVRRVFPKLHAGARWEFTGPMVCSFGSVCSLSVFDFEGQIVSANKLQAVDKY